MILTVDGIVYKCVDPFNLTYFFILWLFGRVDSLEFILEDDYLRYLTNLQLPGDYIRGQLGSTMLRNNYSRRVGPAFQGSSRPLSVNSVGSINAAHVILSRPLSTGFIDLNKVADRNSTNNNYFKRLSTGLRNLLDNRPPVEELLISEPYNFRRVEVQDNSFGFPAMLITLKEASAHLELPDDITLEPARQLIQLLKKTIRKYQKEHPIQDTPSKKKLKMKKQIRRMASSIALRKGADSIQYSEEWYGSHLIMSIEDRNLIRKLVRKCFRIGAVISNENYMKIVNEFKYSTQENMDTGSILNDSKTLTDLGSYCLLSMDRVFRDFPNTRSNFSLYWTIIVNEWKELDDLERRRRSWMQKPSPINDDETLGSISLGGFSDSDVDIESNLIDFNISIPPHKSTSIEPSLDKVPEIPLERNVTICQSTSSIATVPIARIISSPPPRASPEISSFTGIERRFYSTSSCGGSDDERKLDAIKLQQHDTIDLSETIANNKSSNYYNNNYDNKGSDEYILGLYKAEESDASFNEFKLNTLKAFTITARRESFSGDADYEDNSTHDDKGEKKILDKENRQDREDKKFDTKEIEKDLSTITSANSDDDNKQDGTPIVESVKSSESADISGNNATIESGHVSVIKPHSELKSTVIEDTIIDENENENEGHDSKLTDNSHSHASPETSNTSLEDIEFTLPTTTSASISSASPVKEFISPRGRSQSFRDIGSGNESTAASTPRKRYTSPRRTRTEKLVQESEVSDVDDELKFPDKIDKFEKMAGGAPKPTSYWRRVQKKLKLEEDQINNKYADGIDIPLTEIKLTKKKHVPKRKKTRERLQVMTSIENFDSAFDEHDREVFNRNLELKKQKPKMLPLSPQITDPNNKSASQRSSLKERFINLLSDRLRDMSTSTQYRKAAIHPKELYRRFSAPDARAWNNLGTLQKAPYYEAFKRYYEKFIYHLAFDEVIDDETFELIQDLAEICLEFNDVSSPIVMLAISRENSMEPHEDELGEQEQEELQQREIQA